MCIWDYELFFSILHFLSLLASFQSEMDFFSFLNNQCISFITAPPCSLLHVPNSRLVIFLLTDLWSYFLITHIMQIIFIHPGLKQSRYLDLKINEYKFAVNTLIAFYFLIFLYEAIFCKNLNWIICELKKKKNKVLFFFFIFSSIGKWKRYGIFLQWFYKSISMCKAQKLNLEVYGHWFGVHLKRFFFLWVDPPKQLCEFKKWLSSLLIIV